MHLISKTSRTAAIGYSLIYLIAGGGVVGAIVIYIIAKLMGG